MKSILWILSVVALTACGGGRNPDKEIRQDLAGSKKLGAKEVVILSGADTLKFVDGIVEGTGTLRFAESLAKPDSANNFALLVEIPAEGSVSIFANADRGLSGGIEVRLSRIPGSNALQVEAIAGNDRLPLGSSFTGIDASKAMHLSFDLHNDHGENVHLIAWDETVGAELLEDILRGKGYGVNWGLKLQNARVLSSERREPKDKH